MWHFRKQRRQAWQPVLLGLGLLVLVGAVVAKDEPPTVTVVKAVKRKITDYETFAGRLHAAQQVKLRSRVSGILEKIHFKPGATVKKGDLLFEIDARLAKAALEKAEAEVALAEVRSKNAEKNVARLRRLRGTGGASQDDLERAEGTHAETKAAVKLARANLQVAKINLDFTRITAPIDGRIGLPAVTRGNLVTGDGAGATVLATIVNLDPTYVYFDMDERAYLRLKLAEQKGELGKGPIPVWMGLPHEDGFPHKGKVDGIDNRLDPKTGTISSRAVFANPKGLLLPGTFVRVRQAVSKPYTAVAVPEDAVVRLKDDDHYAVYVVNAKNVVEARRVDVGSRTEEGKTVWRVVRTGLKPGEWVVIKGLQRVHPGLKVKPERQKAPDR